MDLTNLREREMLSASLLAIASASLGSADPQQERDIVVEGYRPSRSQALRAVTDLTVIEESQIARFHDPVCPVVVGLVPEAAALVETRVRTVAAEMGVPTRTRPCEANLMVFISGDGTGLVEDMRLRRPAWFEGLAPSEKQRLMADQPVRAWSTSSLRNDDGMRAAGGAQLKNSTPPRERSTLNRAPLGTGMYEPLQKVPSIAVWGGSIIQNVTRYHLDRSLIVMDADAVEGLSLRQLGDYAAMRGLAQLRPKENAGQFDSILSIFDRPKGTGPRELTSFDRRYLGELYRHVATKGFESSVYERQRLARAIADPE